MSFMDLCLPASSIRSSILVQIAKKCFLCTLLLPTLPEMVWNQCWISPRKYCRLVTLHTTRGSHFNLRLRLRSILVKKMVYHASEIGASPSMKFDFNLDSFVTRWMQLLIIIAIGALLWSLDTDSTWCTFSSFALISLGKNVLSGPNSSTEHYMSFYYNDGS